MKARRAAADRWSVCDLQNPFADPTVQAGLNSHAHEEYDAASFKGASTYDLPDQQAAAASGNADMQARLADLQRREQELAVRRADFRGLGADEAATLRSRGPFPPPLSSCAQARETALKQKQEHIRKQSVSGCDRIPAHSWLTTSARPQRSQQLASRPVPSAVPQHRVRCPQVQRDNWSSITDLAPASPLHRDEIPQAHQATMTTIYRIWIFLILTLVINLVGAILLLVSGASNGGSGKSTLQLRYPRWVGRGLNSRNSPCRSRRRHHVCSGHRNAVVPPLVCVSLCPIWLPIL